MITCQSDEQQEIRLHEDSVYSRPLDIPLMKTMKIDIYVKYEPSYRGSFAFDYVDRETREKIRSRQCTAQEYLNIIQDSIDNLVMKEKKFDAWIHSKMKGVEREALECAQDITEKCKSEGSLPPNLDYLISFYDGKDSMERISGYHLYKSKSKLYRTYLHPLYRDYYIPLYQRARGFLGLEMYHDEGHEKFHRETECLKEEYRRVKEDLRKTHHTPLFERVKKGIQRLFKGTSDDDRRKYELWLQSSIRTRNH